MEDNVKRSHASSRLTGRFRYRALVREFKGSMIMVMSYLYSLSSVFALFARWQLYNLNITAFFVDFQILQPEVI